METSLTTSNPALSQHEKKEARSTLVFNLGALERLKQNLEKGYSLVEGLLPPEITHAMAVETEKMREAYPETVAVTEAGSEKVQKLFGCVPSSSYINFAFTAENQDRFADGYPMLACVTKELGEAIGMGLTGIAFNFMDPGHMTPIHKDMAISDAVTLTLSLKGPGAFLVETGESPEMSMQPVQPGDAVRLALVSDGEMFRSLNHAGMNPKIPGNVQGERISMGLVFYDHPAEIQAA